MCGNLSREGNMHDLIWIGVQEVLKLLGSLLESGGCRSRGRDQIVEFTTFWCVWVYIQLKFKWGSKVKISPRHAFLMTMKEQCEQKGNMYFDCKNNMNLHILKSKKPYTKWPTFKVGNYFKPQQFKTFHSHINQIPMFAKYCKAFRTSLNPFQLRIC